MSKLPPTSPWRRARRSFLVLALVAVLASGSLSAALASDPGPLVGLRVAASGLVLVASIALAARVMVALDRAHRQARTRNHAARHTDERLRR